MWRPLRNHDYLFSVSDYLVIFVYTDFNYFQLQVKAADSDQAENGQIVYSIKNATDDLPVSLDPETGEIILTDVPVNKKK